jgi:hypothetical protein
METYKDLISKKENVMTKTRVFAFVVLLLFAVGISELDAAQGENTKELRPTVSGFTVTLMGEVSVSELAASEANRHALETEQNAPLVEHPVHRLPDGSLTSAPGQATLDALPWMTEPNAATLNSDAFRPTFASIKGFIGIHEADDVKVGESEVEPPDQGLAVNNNVATEINNNVVQFFNATTGASLAGPIAASSFFLAPSGTFLFDTQVFFDPTTKRWFLDEIISNNSTIEDFGLAVSKTSSATGSYYIYHISALSSDLSGCGGQDCLPDYPKAGYDKNIFIIDVDLFNATSGSFVEAAAYALPKSKLEAGASFTYVRLDFPSDFVVQPSVPAPGEPFVTAANGTEYLMEARNISDGTTNVRVWAISNTNNIVSNPTSLRESMVDVRAESYGPTVPSTQPNVVGPYCKSQGVTSAPSLDGGYSAFQATIQKASGRLYGVLAFGSNDGTGLNRDVIAWFVLTPSVTSAGKVSATIYKQGYLIPANGYSLSYPAFGLSKTGAGAMGFTQTNKRAKVAGGYPSASSIQFTGTSTTGSIIVKGQGKASDDGFTGCLSPGPGQVGRWGDYGAATVDAATGYVYTANEMIPYKTVATGQAANWGTFITQLH